MAMTVLNNTSAMMTLGELNKNINRVGKDLKKVSTGTKITSAQDDASGYAISERMRVMMRSLDQDEQNVKNGRFLLNVAAGGIDNIVQELRSLKELALNSANDHNTDADRAIIQKEFDQRMANIDDIASETNYNGKSLLDGTYYRPKTQELSAPLDYTSIKKNVAEPQTAQIFPADGVINSDGAYTIPSGFTGTIHVNATNVKLTGSGLTDVMIEGPQGGKANLWIENLDISTNSTGNNIISFHGGNNVLSVKGGNTLESLTGNTNAMINIGEGLIVQGDGTSTLTISGNGTGAGIGTDAAGKSNGDIGIYDAIITFNNPNAQSADAGSAIGSGASGGKVGNIQIENSTISSIGGPVDPGGYGYGQYHAAIGSGSSNSSCGNILIVDSDITAICTDTGVGSGYWGSSCGTISIGNSTLNLTGRLSACIGAGDASTCGDISIHPGTAIISSSEQGASIGSGQNGSSAGDINIYSGVTIDHKSENGAVIGTGRTGKVGIITIDSNTLNNLDASSAWTSQNQTPSYSGIGPGKDGSAGDISSVIVTPGPGNPLVIHHGTKANQSMNVYINDMHTKAMGLDEVTVTTQSKANEAIDAIDVALDYALDEATYVGSYISRLEYTEENIVTANENTQASESTIRDADMAKAMMSYTKNNVLAQASQSMLAQANQTASSVLSLLQ